MPPGISQFSELSLHNFMIFDDTKLRAYSHFFLTQIIFRQALTAVAQLREEIAAMKKNNDKNLVFMGLRLNALNP